MEKVNWFLIRFYPVVTVDGTLWKYGKFMFTHKSAQEHANDVKGALELLQSAIPGQPVPKRQIEFVLRDYGYKKG